MQLSDPAPLDFSELDHRFSILAQITNHLYHDLIHYGTTQLATLEQQHFARARGERAVMSNDDHPDLEVIDDLAQKLVQILGVRAIQISGGLVRQNDLRIHRQSARNRRALLLTAGQLSGAVRHSSAEPDSREQLGRAAPGRLLRPSADSERHHHVLESRKLPKQVMKLKHKTHCAVPQLSKLHFVATMYRLTSNYNIATRRLIQRAKNVHQRALAGTTGPDDGNHLTPLNGQIHAVQNMKRVPIAAHVRLVDVVRL